MLSVGRRLLRDRFHVSYSTRAGCADRPASELIAALILGLSACLVGEPSLSQLVDIRFGSGYGGIDWNGSHLFCNRVVGFTIVAIWTLSGILFGLGRYSFFWPSWFACVGAFYLSTRYAGRFDTLIYDGYARGDWRLASPIAAASLLLFVRFAARKGSTLFKAGVQFSVRELLIVTAAAALVFSLMR